MSKAEEIKIKMLLLLDDWQKENNALTKQGKAWNELEEIYISAMKEYAQSQLQELRERQKKLSNQIIKDWKDAGDFNSADSGRYLQRQLLNLIDQLNE